MTEVPVLGIDLGKNSCSVAGMSASGQIVFRRRVARDGIAALLGKLSPCVVAMEACCGAHHVGRGDADASGRLAARPAGAGPQEHRSGGAGKQARTHRLGGAGARAELRGGSRGGQTQNGERPGRAQLVAWVWEVCGRW